MPGKEVSKEVIARYLRKLSGAIDSSSQEFLSLRGECEPLLLVLQRACENPSLLSAFQKPVGASRKDIAQACRSLSSRDAEMVMSAFDSLGSFSGIDARTRALLSRQSYLLGRVATSLENNAVIGPLGRIVASAPRKNVVILRQALDASVRLRDLVRSLELSDRKLSVAPLSSFLSELREERLLVDDVVSAASSILKSLRVERQLPSGKSWTGLAALFGGLILSLNLLGGCVSLPSGGLSTQGGVQIGVVTDEVERAQQQGIFGLDYSQAFPSSSIPRGWDIVGSDTVSINESRPITVDGQYVLVVGFSSVYSSSSERDAIRDAERDASKTIALITTGMASGESTSGGSTTRVTLSGGQTLKMKRVRVAKAGENWGVIVHVLVQYPMSIFDGAAQNRLQKTSASSPQKQAELLRIVRGGR